MIIIGHEIFEHPMDDNFAVSDPTVSLTCLLFSSSFIYFPFLTPFLRATKYYH